MEPVAVDGFAVRWRRAIVWAFSIIAAGFLADTFVSQWLASSIDTAANRIVTDYAPSIVSLAETRSELHRLQDYAVDYVEGKAVPANRTQMAAATGAVTQAMQRYERLPFIPGERELWQKVKLDVEAVHVAESKTLAAIDRGDRALAQRLAREDLREAVDGASNDILANIELNGAAADADGRLIARHRRESMWAAAILDVVSIALTAVVAILIYRLSAQNNALQRRQAEILREANAELDLFANRLSHDIVSPLALTRLSIDAALRTGPSPEARRVLERGIGGIERATQIAHGLLEFARAGAHPRPDERADVRAVVSGVVDELRPLADKTGARLDASVPDGTTVACDEGLLASAVSNLVRNAINYLDGSGEKRVDVTVESAGPRVKIDVRDTGPGLPPGAEAKVFEPYVRGPGAKAPGLGLGLATVKRIVEGHGGAVGVESQAGAGARFWIELPRAPVAG